MTFEQFVDDHLRSLLRMAMAASMDSALAEDLVQDVLVKVLRRWAYVESREHPEAYVRRMLVNEYISWRRKWARIVPRAEIVLEDEHPDPANVYGDRAALVARLGMLARRQRVVLALRYFEDMADPDIAEVMSCSAGAVRGYASRALARLRDVATKEQSVLEKGSLG